MFNQNPKPIDPESMSTTSSTDAMITKKQSTWEQLQNSLGGKTLKFFIIYLILDN